jgi:hypothetical protein
VSDLSLPKTRSWQNGGGEDKRNGPPAIAAVPRAAVSSARRAQAVPHYFVMVGGVVNESGASFARTVAKVPARRIPAALERLIGLHQAEHVGGETATAFFGRVELPRVKQLLADLETMTSESAEPQDYVDLAERSEFRPQTMDGECAS